MVGNVFKGSIGGCLHFRKFEKSQFAEELAFFPPSKFLEAFLDEIEPRDTMASRRADGRVRPFPLPLPIFTYVGSCYIAGRGGRRPSPNSLSIISPAFSLFILLVGSPRGKRTRPAMVPSILHWPTVNNKNKRREMRRAEFG
jgi:hypothetical protein